MYKCATRFKMEDKQLAFIRALPIYKEGESDEPSKEIEGSEVISDVEEDEVEEELELSIQAGIRLMESDDDDLDSWILESQIRTSGRIRKRPRVLGDYKEI
jgi:hypothetical protein